MGFLHVHILSSYIIILIMLHHISQFFIMFHSDSIFFMISNTLQHFSYISNIFHNSISIMFHNFLRRHDLDSFSTFFIIFIIFHLFRDVSIGFITPSSYIILEVFIMCHFTVKSSSRAGRLQIVFWNGYHSLGILTFCLEIVAWIVQSQPHRLSTKSMMKHPE